MEKEECSTCGANLEAVESFVVFPCPECGEKIARCKDCKKRVNEYECESCGFTGP